MAVNGNGSGHDSDGTYMSSLSGSAGGGGSVVGRANGVAGSSISDLLSPVEAAAERIERELSKDLLATADIFCDTGTKMWIDTASTARKFIGSSPT